MSSLGKIKDYFYDKDIRQKLKGHLVEHGTVSLDQCRMIGLLFNASDPKNVVAVNDFAAKLENEERRVKLFGYINQKSDAMHNFKFFNKKNINWYGKPTGSNVRDFLDIRFDLLISAYMHPCRPLDYLSTFSPARFRISPYFENNLDGGDFFIHITGQDNQLENYLKEVRHYLNSIYENVGERLSSATV